MRASVFLPRLRQSAATAAVRHGVPHFRRKICRAEKNRQTCANMMLRNFTGKDTTATALNANAVSTTVTIIPESSRCRTKNSNSFCAKRGWISAHNSSFSAPYFICFQVSAWLLLHSSRREKAFAERFVPKVPIRTAALSPGDAVW